MDSIFEEDAEEVGGEIEAYCPSPRCKADTTHTIISMYEDEVRRVQCVVCGEVHAYRKPRGDGAEDGAEGGGRASAHKRMTWDDAMARATDGDLANCRPYSIRDAYEEGDVVHHPVFDIGFVTDLLPDNKVEVIFRDSPDARILVHNRGDLASRMPDISEIPVPREQKKKKRAKKPELAASIPQRSRAEVEAAVQRARAAAQARMDEAQQTAEERNKKLKAEASKNKGKKGAAPPAAKAPPSGKAAVTAGAKGAAPAKAPTKGAVAAPSAKGAAKAAPPAKGKAPSKPAKPAKPIKPIKAAAKGAKKPAAKPAKKPAAAIKPKAAATGAKKPAAKAAKKPSKPAKKKK